MCKSFDAISFPDPNLLKRFPACVILPSLRPVYQTENQKSTTREYRCLKTRLHLDNRIPAISSGRLRRSVAIASMNMERAYQQGDDGLLGTRGCFFVVDSKTMERRPQMKTSQFKDYRELPLFLNTKIIAKVLGISSASRYELMHESGFPVLKIGNRTHNRKTEQLF